MWYETKKAILEAYGKDGKNVRWLEKAIQRGFVIERDGMYAFKRDIEGDDISGLKREVEQLRRENEELKKNNNIGEDIMDHLKFFYEMDLARKEAMENLVRAYYNKNQGDGWDAAVEQAYRVMKFSDNPYENDEIEYVKGVIG